MIIYFNNYSNSFVTVTETETVTVKDVIISFKAQKFIRDSFISNSLLIHLFYREFYRLKRKKRHFLIFKILKKKFKKTEFEKLCLVKLHLQISNEYSVSLSYQKKFLKTQGIYRWERKW